MARGGRYIDGPNGWTMAIEMTHKRNTSYQPRVRPDTNPFQLNDNTHCGRGRKSIGLAVRMESAREESSRAVSPPSSPTIPAMPRILVPSLCVWKRLSLSYAGHDTGVHPARQDILVSNIQHVVLSPV